MDGNIFDGINPAVEVELQIPLPDLPKEIVDFAKKAAKDWAQRVADLNNTDDLPEENWISVMEQTKMAIAYMSGMLGAFDKMRKR